jgi:DNA polymerase III epsilon subunit-like protein
MQIVVVDTETGGLIPHKNALLSLAACNFTNTNDTFYMRCKPAEGTICEERALKLNGLDPTESGLPTEHEMLELFHAWLKARGGAKLICGCNVAFDHNFIRAAESRSGYGPYTETPFRKVELQTLAWLADLKGLITVSRKGDDPQFSLDSILKSLGKSRPVGVHGALTDAVLAANACWEILQLLDCDIQNIKAKRSFD